MSRLNRAFIRAFARGQAADRAQVTVDPPTIRHQPTSPAKLFEHYPAAPPTHPTRIPVAYAAAREPSELMSEGLANPYVAAAPESELLVAESPRPPAEATAASPIDGEAPTWVPPVDLSAAADWRTASLADLDEPTVVLDAVASPFIASSAPLGVYSPLTDESLRYDSAHPAAGLGEQPVIEADERPQGLREPALQVDRFAWPAVCLTLMQQADTDFSQLVEELFAGQRQGRKLLAVSGYRRSAGRTTFVLSAARALAARGARVAVVDAEWEQPVLAERLGVAPEFGWQDVLTSGMPLEEALIESLIDGLTLLPARPNSHRTRSVNLATAERNLQLLRSAYDFVLLDAGRLDDPTPDNIGGLLLEQMPIEGLLLVHDVSASSLVNPSITERRLAQMQIRWWRVVENFVASQN